MSTTRTLRIGLTIAAALVMLSACQSATKDDLARVENEVSSLRAQVDDANAKAASAQSTAAQCSQTCEATKEQTQRMYDQSLRK